MKAIQRFRRLPARARVALAVGLLSAVWALFLLLVGGIHTSILGVTLRSNDWQRPAMVAVAALLVFAWLRPRAIGDGFLRCRELLAIAFRRWRTVDGLWLTAILIVAAVARVWALPFGLPYPAARPDEDAVAALAGSYYEGHFEPANFIYPPLFMLVLAATMWLVFTWLPVVLGRLHVDIAIPELTIPTQRITARVLGASAGSPQRVADLPHRCPPVRPRGRPRRGRVSGAPAFLHVRDSHFGVTDMPMSCMVLIAFLAIVKLSQSGARRDLVAAGILTGLAAATKYNAVVLGLPATFAILDDPLRRAPGVRLGRVIVFGLLVVAAFLVVCPYAVLDYRQFIADIQFNARHLAEGHGADLGRGWVYHLTTTLRYGLGSPLLVAGVLGLPLMMWREGRKGVLVALFRSPLRDRRQRTDGVRPPHPPGRTVSLPDRRLCGLGARRLDCGRAEPSEVASGDHRRDRRGRSVAFDDVLIALDRLLAREDTRVAAGAGNFESRFAPRATIAQFGASNGRPYGGGTRSGIDCSRRSRLRDRRSSSSSRRRYPAHQTWQTSRRGFERQVRPAVRPSGRRRKRSGQRLRSAGRVLRAVRRLSHVHAPGPNLRIFVRRDTAVSRPAAPKR